MVTMTWFGPFNPGNIVVAGQGIDVVRSGTQLIVSTDVGGGMLAADPSWWAALLDGGSAATTYTDGIDGGNARFVGAGAFAGPGARG